MTGPQYFTVPTPPIVGDSQSCGGGQSGNLGTTDQANLAVLQAALDTHEAALTGPHYLGQTWLDKFYRRGLVRAGLGSGQAGVFFDDFTDLARWVHGAGVNDITALTTVSGGVAHLHSPAGNSNNYILGTGLTATGVFPGGGRFYFAARMSAVASLLGATGCAAFGGNNGGQFLIVGAASAQPKFLMGTVNGGPIEAVASTVSIDANYHVFECWSDGAGRYYFAVDDETPVVLTPAAPLTLTMAVCLFAWAAGLATDATVNLDKLLVLYPQAV